MCEDKITQWYGEYYKSPV